MGGVLARPGRELGFCSSTKVTLTLLVFVSVWFSFVPSFAV
jgi:hypothetical protein